MKNDSYKTHRSAKQYFRLLIIAFALSCLLMSIFVCQLYGWLLGHPIIIGNPLFILSDSIKTYLIILNGLFFAGTIFSIKRQQYPIAGALILISAISLCFIFKFFYHPLNIISWLYSYWSLPQLTTVNRHLLLISIGYLIYIIVGFLFLFKRKQINLSGNHGTAKLTDGDQLINDQGFIVGRHAKSGKLMRYNGDMHLVTIAPTGAGKGVGAIIPNLITYPHSVIQVDPKGENCNHTWRRRKKMKQDIIVLDPFHVTNYAKAYGTKRFNPFDSISPDDPSAKEYCNEIANIIITKNPSGDQFWFNSAVQMYSGLMYYIVKAPEYNDKNHPQYEPDFRNLATINDLLNLPKEVFMDYIKKISKSNLSLDVKTVANRIDNDNKSQKMLAGIIKTLQVNIEFIGMPYIRPTLTESDFEISSIIKKPSTLYIVMPQHKLQTYDKWLAMIVTTIIHRAIELRGTTLTKTTGNQLLFSLDEFANLGRLDYIRQGYSILRGYGITFWVFLQNITQFKKLYKDDWESFIANSGILQSFNSNDLTTTEYISDLMGETTVFAHSNSHNKDAGHRSKNISEIARPLRTPTEIKTMDSDKQLLMPSGDHPVIADKIYYFNDKHFQEKYLTREQVSAMSQSLPQPPLPNRNENIEKQLLYIIHGGDVPKRAKGKDKTQKNKASKDKRSNNKTSQPTGKSIDIHEWEEKEQDNQQELEL